MASRFLYNFQQYKPSEYSEAATLSEQSSNKKEVRLLKMYHFSRLPSVTCKSSSGTVEKCLVFTVRLERGTWVLSLGELTGASIIEEGFCRGIEFRSLFLICGTEDLSSESVDVSFFRFSMAP